MVQLVKRLCEDMGLNPAEEAWFFSVCVTIFLSMVLVASIFSTTIGISNYGLSNCILKTIVLSEYQILDRQVRKTIRLSDIGNQTQTIGLSDFGFKKKLSFAHLW